MTEKKPLGVTDRRKHKHRPKVVATVGQGSAAPLAIFNDRRHSNGAGRKAS